MKRKDIIFSPLQLANLTENSLKNVSQYCSIATFISSSDVFGGGVKI